MFLKKLVHAFDKEQIPYTIVGGYAVVIHGVVRGTVDIDILTSLELTHLANLEKTLRKLGLESRIPVTAENIFNFRKEYIENKNLVAWSFINPKNPAEIVDVLITHDESEFESQSVEFKGFKARVINKDSLIKLKKYAGRPQDLEDIKALEKIK